MQHQYTLTVLLVLGLALRSTNAISCYTCSSTINAANSEIGDSGCAAGTASATSVADANVFSCKTVFSTTVGGLATITRSTDTSVTSATTASNYCTSSGSGTTCYCNSEKCNSNALAAPRTYQCYECTSSEYFDNGCGEKFDATSKWIKTIQGCSACYKNTVVDNDLSVTYTRGCTRSFDVEATCSELGGSKVCGCEKDLCNSAITLKSSSLAVAAVFIFIAKLLC